MPPYITYQRATNGHAIFHLHGRWEISALQTIRSEIENILTQSTFTSCTLELGGIASIDTAGAWQIERLRQHTQGGAEVKGLKPEHQAILMLVSRSHAAPPIMTPPPGLLVGVVMRLGKAALSAWAETLALLRFIGETSATLVNCIRHPRRLRISSIIRHIDETGIDAIPIVALIAFLISVVLAYQGASQLKRFGAEIFTINMVGVSVLREMGVLLTAIMVAGRSGSAFTAEIGVMKVNEEVDAMRVIGLNPFEVLVLPRLIALAITLPILTFLADMMGALGGGIICYVQLNIPPVQYVEQFRNSVSMSDFWVGLIKAPIFASLIAVVGCMRGMEVSGSAESVGRLTTVSVVHSIFLVLLADALFSILFTKLGV